jgi:hypothetical protein
LPYLRSPLLDVHYYLIMILETVYVPQHAGGPFVADHAETPSSFEYPP